MICIITVNTYDIVKQLSNQASIDDTKVSPSLGVNVKLLNSEEPNSYFTGTVVELIPTVKNANSSIYSSMKLDGVDNLGGKKR